MKPKKSIWNVWKRSRRIVGRPGPMRSKTLDAMVRKSIEQHGP